ncbi:MAG: discoidin domain-containing protein [Spirochaetales bacterium]|nr:discoidin domain-containing protein [Spirochaetales bacterium]
MKLSTGLKGFISVLVLSTMTLIGCDTGTATVSVTGVSLGTSAVSMKVGDTLQLAATVAPTDATVPDVEWSSGDSAVATVADGLITAVSTGSAVITVSTTDGAFSAACTVSVGEILSTADDVAVSVSSYLGHDPVDGVNQPDFAWGGWTTVALNNGYALSTEALPAEDQADAGTIDVWGNARPVNAYTSDNSDAAGEEWIQYDFGAVRNIIEVVLYPRNNDNVGVNFPQDYIIQVSDDGTTWTDALSVSAPEADYNPGADAVSHYVVAAGRYFRLYITKKTNNETNSDTEYRAQLMELEVYGY